MPSQTLGGRGRLPSPSVHEGGGEENEKPLLLPPWTPFLGVPLTKPPVVHPYPAISGKPGNSSKPRAEEPGTPCLQSC